MEEAKVGAAALAYCTSCRTMREHVIVAMVGPRPAKVECSECHKQHLYRATAPTSSVGGKSASSKRRAAEAPRTPRGLAAIDLAARIAGRDARTYDPRVGFGLGEVVRHPSFGIGVVTALPGAQKMEVTFEAGAKLLAHDRAAAVAPTLTRPIRRDEEDRHRVTDAPPDRPPAR